MLEVRGSPDRKSERLTVWFNAWKYESTNQVWAGMADAIIKQVGDRLGPVRREAFFFRLHLRRIDLSKVRNRITDNLLSSLIGSFSRWLWLYGIVPVLFFALHWARTRTLEMPWKFAAIIGLLIAVFQFLVVKRKSDNEPAEFAVGELVQAPDYNSNLGFVHQVSEDLEEALKLVPQNKRPLVIFVDDLDRCSPNKVSDVVEAINLFLAGEFPHCMFVLGIDDEVIAAALSKAHGEVFSRMPSYARASSVGWRFMDKFVQLPFIVPPPSVEDLDRYTSSLLVSNSDIEDSGGRHAVASCRIEAGRFCAIPIEK